LWWWWSCGGGGGGGFVVVIMMSELQWSKMVGSDTYININILCQ